MVQGGGQGRGAGAGQEALTAGRVVGRCIIGDPVVAAQHKAVAHALVRNIQWPAEHQQRLLADLTAAAAAPRTTPGRRAKASL